MKILFYYYDGSYRRLWKVKSLKDETHGHRQLDDFTAHEAEFLVVVKNCVHVLDPDRINWSIKDDPLSVRCVGRRKLTEGVGRHTVWPLMAKGKETGRISRTETINIVNNLHC